MPKTSEEISFQLATKLSPPGVLASSLGSTIRKFWMGIADEFSRLYGRIDQLIKEARPSTTDEMLPEWEKEFGLPDPCVTLTQSLNDRRAALASKFTALGGGIKQYFIDVAASLGLSIDIGQETPFLVGFSHVGDAIGGGEVAFTWHVTVATATAIQKQMLECIFDRIRPLHTTVTFSYIVLTA